MKQEKKRNMTFRMVDHPNSVEILDSHVVFWDREAIRKMRRSRVFTRSELSMYVEWFIHSLCFRLHFQRERARNTLFELDGSWFINMFKGLRKRKT